MKPSTEDLEKFNRALDRMKLSEFFEFLSASMAKHVKKHAARKDLHEQVNQQNATVAELLRRVAALEAKNG